MTCICQGSHLRLPLESLLAKRRFAADWPPFRQMIHYVPRVGGVARVFVLDRFIGMLRWFSLRTLFPAMSMSMNCSLPASVVRFVWVFFCDAGLLLFGLLLSTHVDRRDMCLQTLRLMTSLSIVFSGDASIDRAHGFQL